jgi:hypothetical protein
VQEASAKLPPALQQGINRVVGEQGTPTVGGTAGAADPAPTARDLP